MSKQTHNGSRRFFIMVLWAGVWAALVGTLALGVGALLRFVGGGQGPQQQTRVKLGQDAGLSVGQVRSQGPVALVRDAGGLFALSLVCPHLGCRTAWQQDKGRFLCPCHGSSFAPDGARLFGPAPKGLTHIKLERTSNGLIAIPETPVTPEVRL